VAFKDKADASKYIYQYTKDNYDRISLTVPAGEKDSIKAHAATRGESVNAFINRAIQSQIAADKAPED